MTKCSGHGLVSVLQSTNPSTEAIETIESSESSESIGLIRISGVTYVHPAEPGFSNRSVTFEREVSLRHGKVSDSRSKA